VAGATADYRSRRQRVATISTTDSSTFAMLAVLLSGVFQRVSSDSLASCRSVWRVKQTWIRGAMRQCTGDAIVHGAQSSTSAADPYTAKKPIINHEDQPRPFGDGPWREEQ
jgi:hypothetical protein